MTENARTSSAQLPSTISLSPLLVKDEVRFQDNLGLGMKQINKRIQTDR
jgi:hypothetical protein